MNKEKVVRVGFLGLGVVGQGAWGYLNTRRAQLEEAMGGRIELVRAAVRETGRQREVEISPDQLTDDPAQVVNDPDIDIVCELMGGVELAGRFVRQALEGGKTVVTANKALLCEQGDALMAAARQGGGGLLFEASVAGGIPVVKVLKESLVANCFPRIFGILNGTSNYILTRMEREGLSFEQTVGAARELGYVEADESLDLDGWDAAHKAVVLAYLAYGKWFSLEDISVEGIRRLTSLDLSYAAKLGCKVKLIASIERETADGPVQIWVSPALLPEDSVMASVDEVFNGVSLQGDVAGPNVLIGRGAGRDPTASAVIADIVEAGKQIIGGQGFALPQRDANGVALASEEQIFSEFYIRLEVQDRLGVLAEVARVFAEEEVSIAQVMQHDDPQGGTAHLVLLTHRCSRGRVGGALARVAAFDSVLEAPLCFPILAE